MDGCPRAAYLWGCGHSRSQRAAPPCPRSRRSSGKEARKGQCWSPWGCWVPTLSSSSHPTPGCSSGLLPNGASFPPVLKREEELARTITVTLTGLNSSRDLQQDNFHPPAAAPVRVWAGRKASLAPWQREMNPGLHPAGLEEGKSLGTSPTA